MKRSAAASLLVAGMLLTALLSGCSREAGGRRWICTATSAANGAVSLCEGTLRTDTGMLCIRNPANTDVTVFLYDASDAEAPRYTLNVAAGGVNVQYQVPPDTEFAVGLSANVKAAGEITVVVSDYPDPNPYLAD